MERNEITLISAIETTYFQHLVQNYVSWLKPVPCEDTTIKDRMFQEFKDGLTFTKGRNYVKIISSRHGHSGNSTVHSFVVIKPTKGFEIGDVLKAASWAAPATNYKRGNVFELESLPGITWTGA